MKVPPRIPLAMVPTPIEPLRRISAQYGVELSVKREDLTGLLTTGNKIRKLEYLLADARERACDTVVTCGGAQSNHARATAALAAQLGIQCVLLLRGAREAALEGNLLLDRLFGAEILPVTPDEYRRIDEAFARTANELMRRGRKPYVIPEGGSNHLGAWGYIQVVEEIMAQTPAGGPSFDSVVCAVGSGGTLAGLLLGAKLSQAPFRIWGINVSDTAAYFKQRVLGILREAIAIYDLPVEIRESEIEILDGYVGEGYGRPTPEQLRLITQVAQQEGIVLDPVYTAKAFCGLLDRLKKEPDRFGKRILFLHTGGVFSLFAYGGALEAVL